MTTDMTGAISMLKEHWEKAKDLLSGAGTAVQNALKTERRRLEQVEMG